MAALAGLYYGAGIGVVITIVSLQIFWTTGIVQVIQGLAAGLVVTAQQIGAAIGVSAASLIITAMAQNPAGALNISTPGYRAALLGGELFLGIALILASYLFYRGFVRRDFGIPGALPLYEL